MFNIVQLPNCQSSTMVLISFPFLGFFPDDFPKTSSAVLLIASLFLFHHFSTSSAFYILCNVFLLNSCCTTSSLSSHHLILGSLLSTPVLHILTTSFAMTGLCCPPTLSPRRTLQSPTSSMLSLRYRRKSI